MSRLGNGRLGEKRLGSTVTLNLGFSDAEIAEINSKKCRPAVFLEIEFSSEVKRYWSRPYDIGVDGDGLGSGSLGTDELGGKTYIGTDGAFLDLGAIEQTVDIKTTNMTINLSGIDADLRSIATTPSDYKDARVKIQLGFVDEDKNLVTDPPATVWQGFTNRIPLKISSGDGARINLEAVGPLGLTKRSDTRYWRDQDQKRDYPDDDFFKNSGILKNQTIDVYGSEFVNFGPIKYLSGDNTPQWKIHMLRSLDREDMKIQTGQPEISEDARNVVYGQARIRNPITFAQIDSDQLHFVMPLADHRCQSLDQFWLSNNLIWEDGSFASGVDSSKWRIQFHDGDKDQVADNYLVNNADGFTESMRGRGVSYVSVSMDARIGVFNDGQKLRPEAVVSGKNDILNPLTGNVGYTTNLGLCLRDYLLGSRYGPGALGSDLGKATWERLYRLSDAQLRVAGGDRIDRFSMNGSFDTSRSRGDILRNMLKQCGGYIAQIGGQLEVVGGFMESSSMTDIDEDDMVGKISVDYGAGKAGSVNSLRGAVQLEDQDFSDASYTVVDDEKVDEDGGERWGTYDLPFSKNEHEARRLGSFALQQEVYSMAGSWEGAMRLMQAPAGSRVKASNSFLETADSDWSNKELFITKSRLNINPDGITFEQSFRETATSEYTFTIQEDDENTTGDDETTTRGEGGPFERIQVREWEGVDLSPNGEEGDTEAKQVTVPAGGELLVEGMGCWELDTNDRQSQTNNLEVVAYAEDADTTIKSTSQIKDVGEQEFNTDVEDTVSFYLQNLGSDRIAGHGVVAFQVREE